MLKRLRQRWRIIPVRYKLVPLVILFIAISAFLLYLHGHDPAKAHALRGLLTLPLMMASLLFGLRGGLAGAFLIGFDYLLLAELRPASFTSQVQAALELGVVFLVGGLTGVLVDRERREARRVSEAENLALLGMAAAAVAHELKNPLVAIGGFAQRIYRDLEEEHPHRDKLRIIVEQAGYMEGLLRDMLDFSRPVELRPAPVALNQLVDEVLAMASQPAEEAGVGFASRLDPAVGVLPVDAGRLRQVLLNLVLNAVQASPAGGLVSVATSRDGNKEVVFSVADQGPGIPPEIREKIFLPFFTTKAKGTGLGLAICNKLVKAHGGCLEVKDAPKRGSLFLVRLRA